VLFCGVHELNPLFYLNPVLNVFLQDENKQDNSMVDDDLGWVVDGLLELVQSRLSSLRGVIFNGTAGTEANGTAGTEHG